MTGVVIVSVAVISGGVRVSITVSVLVGIFTVSVDAGTLTVSLTDGVETVSVIGGAETFAATFAAGCGLTLVCSDGRDTLVVTPGFVFVVIDVGGVETSGAPAQCGL